MHCFHGDAGFIEVGITGLDGNNYINVYDCGWELPFILEHPCSPFEILTTCLFKDVLISARESSKHIEYCCIDIMHGIDDIYCNSILSPYQGKLILFPAGWDSELGKIWIMTPYK